MKINKPDKGKKESKASEMAKDLTLYVYQLTKNPKRFPKRYQDSFTKILESLANMALSELRIVDQYYPEPTIRSQYEERITHSKRAIAYLHTLDTQFCLAYEMDSFVIGEKTMQHFSEMLTETLRLATNRQIADIKRFGKEYAAN